MKTANEELTPRPLERIELEERAEFHPFVSAAYPDQIGEAPPGILEGTQKRTKKLKAHRKIFPRDEPRLQSIYTPVYMLPAQRGNGFVIVANPQAFFDAKLAKTKVVYCRTLPKTYWHHERLAEIQAEIEVLKYLANKNIDRMAAAERYYIAINFSHLREYLFNLHNGELSGRCLGAHLGLKHTRVIEQKNKVNNNRYILDLAEDYNNDLEASRPKEIKRKKGNLL